MKTVVIASLLLCTATAVGATAEPAPQPQVFTMKRDFMCLPYEDSGMYMCTSGTIRGARILSAKVGGGCSGVASVSFSNGNNDYGMGGSRYIGSASGTCGGTLTIRYVKIAKPPRGP